MIRCKLVQTTSEQDTGTSRVARAVAGEMLGIGRAAACKIFLPDPRVRLEHAAIRRGEDGALYLHASGPVAVDRQAQNHVRLALGQRIGIGPYDFIVEELQDGADIADPRLTLAFALRQSSAVAAAPTRVGVTQGWLSRRALAWVLSLLVLLAGGLWPLWHAYQQPPAPADAAAAALALRAPVAVADVRPGGAADERSGPASEELRAIAQALEPIARKVKPIGEAIKPVGEALQPVAQALQPLQHWAATHGQRLDTYWNPGPLSSAHQLLAQDCRACHDKPFERVVDASCTRCHQNVGDHVRDPVVAHTTFPGQRCATCHKEHQGSGGMRVTDSVGCAQCHGSIRSFSPQTVLGNVSDFARDHPAFRLSMRSRDAAQPMQRLRQSAQLRQDSGLVFAHDIHLAKAGIRSPTGQAASGGRVVLKCADCHTPDAAGVRFEPVTMARNCQSCHRLSIDPQAPEREVPHARPEVVEVAVRELYASLAVDRFPVNLTTVNSLLQRPGAHSPLAQTSSAARWVEQSSRATTAHMFSARNGVCTTCHAVQFDNAQPAKSGSAGKQATSPQAAVSQAAGMQSASRQTPSASAGSASRWLVPAIVQNGHWLPASTFSHAQHKNAECSTCHRASTSKMATDILIPDLQTCRTCHAGAQAQQDKVVSQCDSCHQFHPRKEHPVFRQGLAAPASALHAAGSGATSAARPTVTRAAPRTAGSAARASSQSRPGSEARP